MKFMVYIEDNFRGFLSCVPVGFFSGYSGYILYILYIHIMICHIMMGIKLLVFVILDFNLKNLGSFIIKFCLEILSYFGLSYSSLKWAPLEYRIWIQ